MGKKEWPKGCTDRGAEDLYVRVPRAERPSEMPRLAKASATDLVENGQEYIVAHGGRGGRGNIHLLPPKESSSRDSENGEPVGNANSNRTKVQDVGLVGFLCWEINLFWGHHCANQIGAYYSTTIVPNLGMVRRHQWILWQSQTFLDLIEGASQGVGLGTQFLRRHRAHPCHLAVIDVSE